MQRLLLLMLLISLAAGTIRAGQSKAKLPLENTEWTDIWITNADQDNLPRVLLVGDSITHGYFSEVEKVLDGKASCARYTTSGFMGNPDYLDELKILLGRYRFKVIHVNNGLHGWDYTEAQYRQSLPGLMETLRRYGAGATLIWASTTPTRSPDNPAQLAADTNRVQERNRIAAEYMQRHGIALDDLYTLVADHPEYYVDDHTHFNAQGQAVEAQQVGGAILRVLEGTSATKP